MIALIGNINWMELLIVALIAVMVFGRDLPHVAAKGFVQLQKLRRGVAEVWRESGIGQEMRNLSRQLEDTDREARDVAARARRIQSEIYRGREQPRSGDRPEDAAADEEQERAARAVPPAGAVPGTRAVEGGPSRAAGTGADERGDEEGSGAPSDAPRTDRGGADGD